MSIPVNSGYASSWSVTDQPATEACMRDGSLNSQAHLEAIAYKYAQIQNYRSIDFLASTIEQYDGFVTGFNGENDMFSEDGTMNIISRSEWGHAIWVGAHTALRHHYNQSGQLVHPNEKMLKFKNSWSALWGDNGYGYIPECLIADGGLFDAYVYADIKDLLTTVKRVIKKANSVDAFIVESGRLYKIPDLETFSYLRDELKVITGEVESVSNDEFSRYLEGRNIPSIAVATKLASLYPALRDAYEPNQG